MLCNSFLSITNNYILFNIFKLSVTDVMSLVYFSSQPASSRLTFDLICLPLLIYDDVIQDEKPIVQPNIVFIGQTMYEKLFIFNHGLPTYTQCSTAATTIAIQCIDKMSDRNRISR